MQDTKEPEKTKKRIKISNLFSKFLSLFLAQLLKPLELPVMRRRKVFFVMLVR